MKKFSLRFQMMVVLALVLLIIILFAQILYVYFERQYSSKLLQINAGVTTQLVESVNTRFQSLSEALSSFTINKTVNRFLSTDSEYEKLTLLPLFDNLKQSYKQMNPGLYSIALKKKDGTIFSDASTSSILVANTKPAFEALEKGEQSCLIVSKNKAYVALYKDVYQSGELRKHVGSCMFVITAETFMGNLSGTNSSGREVIVLDSNQQIIASTNMLPGSTLLSNYAVYLNNVSDEVLQTQDHDYIAVSCAVPSVGWTILCITPKAIVFSELTGIQLTTYLLLLSMLVMVSMIYLLQEASLSHAFRHFVAHMNAISNGKHVTPLALSNSAEFIQISDAFNRMMRQLDTLNQNNLEYHEKLLLQEIENKQTHLLALQSQINPHFLYNTLECINSAGAVCGCVEVEEMSTALASIFRYAIKGEKIVCLQAEIDTLQYYLKIQQIRFPNFFTVEYDIPPALMQKRMLKFILQPIVENSISHGFRNCKPPCKIKIEVRENEQKLVFLIEDNGMGIEHNQLLKLRQAMEHPPEKTDSIGLMNIQRRIRLYYGNEYGLQINSVFGSGTSITLCLPILNEENC